MPTKKSTVYEMKIVLTEKQAHALKMMLQNPMNEEESKEESYVRELIWKELEDVP